MSRPRRRSSGVEHSLGKGGVGSSILPGGTVSHQALSRNPRISETGDNCANAQKRPSSVRGTSPPEQLELPLAAAPATVRGHGLRAAHPFPLVSPGKRPGRPYTSFRTTPEKAWHFPEVEYGNAGSSIAALVLDCDNPAELRRGLPDLPDPNWIVWRPANDHAHVCWTLAKPVHRYSDARIEPLRYLAGIADYYAQAVGADPGYAGVLAHNPTSIDCSPYRTTWGRRDPYTLDQLASVIPFGWKPPTVRQTGVGRNLDLFEAGMRWAGRLANEHLDVLPALLAANQDFHHPLPLSEVQATAKQIEKYRRRWAPRGWHCPRWIKKQAARSAKQTGKARKASASREGSNEALRPWEAEGISRRTWYRRRKAAGEDGTIPNTDKRGKGCP